MVPWSLGRTKQREKHEEEGGGGLRRGAEDIHTW